jgi:hypothetical protein
MKASHSHFFELAVDRLDGAAMVRRSNSAQPVEGCLLDRTCATGQTPDSVRIAAASKRADAGLVPQQRSSCRQSLRQLMNGGQIVQRSWQKCEVHRFTSQRTDPMQAPTKELLLRGSTVTAYRRAHAPCGNSGHCTPTARNKQRVNHTRFPRREEFTQLFGYLGYQQQSVPKGTWEPIEAGDTRLGTALPQRARAG